MKRYLILMILPIMFSCQEKFNGKDKESFKVSREKVEEKLDDDEKTNVEKAMRVIALEAMRLKWEHPEKYDGKSFNDISLKMIDGLSYSSVVDLAEGILKERNKKEIDKTTKDIDTLNLLKDEIITNQKKLNLFKVANIKLNKTDFFDEMVPELVVDYQYTGKSKLKGPKTILLEVKQKSTQELIKSETIIIGNDESLMESGESVTEHIILSQTKESNPKLWNSLNYPVENLNLSDYGLELKVSVLSLVLNGEKVEMPKSKIEGIEAEIKNKKEELKELKAIKGSLDELKLTDK